MQFSRIAAITIALGFNAAAAAVTSQPAGKIDENQKAEVLDLSQQPAAGVWTFGRKVPGANWLRLRIELKATKPLQGLSIDIESGSGTTIESRDLAYLQNVVFWSKFIPGNEFAARIRGAAQPGATLTIAIARDRREPEPLSIVEPDGRVDIANVPDATVRQVSRAVVKLLYQDVDITRSCTGFLISPQRVITNEHCFHDQFTCSTAVAWIDHLGTDVPPASRQYRCKTYRDSDRGLDVSVIDLDEAVPNNIAPLRFADTPASAGQTVRIIQFATNEPKRISSDDCSAVATPVEGYLSDSDFTHRCDTVLGSSGSPVLNAQFRIVGLHHLGINGNPLNRAVRLEPLRAWLLQKNLITTNATTGAMP